LGLAGKAIGGFLVVLRERLIGTTLSSPCLILGLKVGRSDHILAADDLACDRVNMKDGACFVIDVAVKWSGLSEQGHDSGPHMAAANVQP
jgi:hypothetical protein